MLEGRGPGRSPRWGQGGTYPQGRSCGREGPGEEDVIYDHITRRKA